MTRRNIIPPLVTARQTQDMIGRDHVRKEIIGAIHPPKSDRSFGVVFVQALGGHGKTRLLEELRDEIGPPDPLKTRSTSTRASAGDTVGSDLIDLIDIRLHERYQFVTALRNSLRGHSPPLSFVNFDYADNQVKEKTASGALLKEMEIAKDEAITGFVSDLKEITRDRRVVLLIDTLERLSYVTAGWVFKNKLLEPKKDLASRTNQWLQQFIEELAPDNITLVLAGRPDSESTPVFARMKDAAKVRACEQKNIELGVFSIRETREYFDSLAKDWAKEAQKDRMEQIVDEGTACSISKYFEILGNENLDMHRIIWLYTGGVPVRLALYAQIIAEDINTPEPLRKNQSFREACAEVGIDPEDIPEDTAVDVTQMEANAFPKLRLLRWQIEDAFVNLLYGNPSSVSQVLLALIRSPRGLTAEQIHFVLDSKTDEDPAKWKPDPVRLGKLTGILRKIETYYLGKRRSTWGDLEDIVANDLELESATYRIGLQDEIYRIFGDHVGLFAEPLSDDTADIRESISDEESKRYVKSRDTEKRERLNQYRKLARWADYQHERFVKMKREFLVDDERDFEKDLRIYNPRTYYFLPLGDEQVRRRAAVNAAIAIFEIERMVYHLLLDPVVNLNSHYITLEDDKDTAARQEDDFWAQSEMWRVLNDDDLMSFVDFHQRMQVIEREEGPLEILRRVARQEDIARWIKRFVLRGSYQRAFEFGEKVDSYIIGRLHEDESNFNEWCSWNHTFARAERLIWREYARIRFGDKKGIALPKITKMAELLSQYFESPVDEEFTSELELREFGFRGNDQEDDHPARIRLGRLLSHAHNIIGYGNRQKGELYNAVNEYGLALNYIRPDKNMPKAHLATVLNNLSHSLSDMGWPSTAVCLDGLTIRKELAEEVPLAASYNTLALIYDDMGRYEDAPLLSAKAIAYCRRAAEPRQQGLSLRQMAESLRHLGAQIHTGQRATATPDAYFTAAEDLLRTAHRIFTEEVEEIDKQIEVEIELGSILRDRLHTGQIISSHRDARQEIARKGLDILTHAEREANEFQLQQHVLDAQLNRALIHYYIGEREATEAILDKIIEQDLYSEHIITKNEIPVADKPAVRNRAWIFRHFSTLQLIRGWLALDEFQNRVLHYRDIIPRTERGDQLKCDVDAKKAARAAVIAYALGIRYAELYSPASRFISSMQNDLYNRLKESNLDELTLFHEQLDSEWFGDDSTYPSLADTYSLLDRFFHQFFGFQGHIHGHHMS